MQRSIQLPVSPRTPHKSPWRLAHIFWSLRGGRSAIFVFAAGSFVFSTLSAVAQEPVPTFSGIVLFGDSLSDTGNVRDRTDSRSGGLVDYPSHTFNYSNGRFTNDDQTDPASHTYAGVWHEQLAFTLLGIQPATYSLGGGLNYAFGGATTENGTHEEVAVSTDFGDITITIDDMGKQMDDYLASHSADLNALYIVWGGSNDMRNDDSPANVTAAAARATALVGRLAHAGAQYIMVPNAPPLGEIPHYANNPAKIISGDAGSASFRQQLNADLDALLVDLAASGITPTLYRVDAWTNTIRTLAYPGDDGFINTRIPSQDGNVNPDQFLFWDDIHPTTAAHFGIAKGAHNALTRPFLAPARLQNLATRLFADTGEQVSIAGFIIDGDVPKKVLLRGIGPSLSANGVSNLLADPTLTLFDGQGNMLQTNDNWRDSQAAEIMATGIPPQNDLEAAIVATLQPGHYTVPLAGRNNTTGNGLVEVYDLEPGTDSTLANLSTRGFVGAGDNVMIGGLIVGSGENPLMVVRAIGPSLASSGIANPLLDPTIELYDGNGASIGQNDDWRDGQLQAIRATELAPTDDRESAIVAFPTSGNYTAVVRGKSGATGVALVEAYRLK